MTARNEWNIPNDNPNEPAVYRGPMPWEFRTNAEFKQANDEYWERGGETMAAEEESEEIQAQKVVKDTLEEIQAQKIVKDALESQGGRHRSEIINLLAAHLMAGGKPETYAERFAQMALQEKGLLKPTEE